MTYGTPPNDSKPCAIPYGHTPAGMPYQPLPCKGQMIHVNIIIAAAITALTLSILAQINKPEMEPRWPAVIQGFSFSPVQSDEDPTQHILPTVEEIDADLALLKGKAYAVRSYSMEGSFAEIAPLAKKHGLNATIGVWLGPDLEENERQIEKAIRVANENRNVVRVIVGNEVIYRNDLPQEKLFEYIDRVREAVGQPVSSAEIWGNWLAHPELADHVDFIAAHILPYWEGVAVDRAVDFVVSAVDNLKLAFPDKQVVIAEVGWPSNGRTRRAAVASPPNEATFLRRFLARAAKKDYVYYVLEAFDQPWKESLEGAVGAYWGVWNTERQPKFSFEDPIVATPEWRILGGVSVLLALIIFLMMVVPSRSLRRRGRSFLAVIAFSATTVAVWVVHDYMEQYLSASSIAVGLVLLVGMVGVIAVLFAEAHEWAEALWVTGRRREVKPLPLPDSELPLISIHVPAYNEPPEMMFKTLDALARLDYPHFEVLVIDNNTRDPALWLPVQAHCEQLGERFRFFHVEPLEGFKAGALNFALKQTVPEAEIVAVIDSDYQVHPRWLRDLAPQFSAPRVAIVQAPQDYRDGTNSAFKAMCYSEYAGFFYIGMITRNERNAIIQHGTMTMVRRSVLQQVGGWAEWCITEDAELGLRIFEEGHEALYIPRSYGRGVMPDTFIDYKSQRYRWAYGSVQILRHHLGKLFLRRGNKLTPGQRYHFIAGWLPWFADGFNLLFNLGALGWSLAMILQPKQFDAPLMVFSALPLALFVFKNAKLIYIYRMRIGASTAQTFAGALAGLALAHTISRAILLGLFTSKLPFIRTPKLAGRQAWRRAIAGVKEESLLLLALCSAALGVSMTHGTDSSDLLLWVIVLLVQSFPYLASLLVSIISSFPRLSAHRIGVRQIEEAME